MGLPLTAVLALAHRLAIPDVALGALLRAHELVTGGLLGHPHGTRIPLSDVAGRHTAPVSTDVGAALFKRFTFLAEVVRTFRL